MKIYRIPVCRRILISNRALSNISLRLVDGIGLYVEYEEDEPTDQEIRSSLIGGQSSFVYLEANSFTGAINKFFQDFKGPRTGGRTYESRAIWINTQKPILELPDCERMHKNKKEEFICGQLEEEGEYGEYGLCMLEGYDQEENCPLISFFDQYHDVENLVKPEVFGRKYKIVRSKTVLALGNSHGSDAAS